MIHRLRQVTPTLFRGSAPTPKDVEWLKKSLGIRKIVSLDQESGDKIDQVAKKLGLQQIKMYITDHISLAQALHHNLKKLLLQDGPTFIHCKHGKDRTGLIVALLECKYLGVSPQYALQEAKSLGFGIGVDPKTIHLYEKLIQQCKPSTDTNSADIVGNEREYIGDNRDTFLDESRQDSFSPYLDHTRQAPADFAYNYIYDQSPTRQNYPSYKAIKEHNEKVTVPQVGMYNADGGGLYGSGPTFPEGGFISD
jgi:protein tyrosine/serine phosphatase